MLSTKVEERRRHLQEAVGSEVARIVRQYRPQRVLLFGSLARGDVNAGSDIDLLIIKENPEPNFKDRVAAVLDCCTGKVPVELFVYSTDEMDAMLRRGNDFIRTVLSEGIVVYEE